MRYKKTKPMSIKRINLLLKDIGSNYHLEKEDDNTNIIMVENPHTTKQVQPNLLAHLKK